MSRVLLYFIEYQATTGLVNELYILYLFCSSYNDSLICTLYIPVLLQFHEALLVTLASLALPKNILQVHFISSRISALLLAETRF